MASLARHLQGQAVREAERGLRPKLLQRSEGDLRVLKSQSRVVQQHLDSGPELGGCAHLTRDALER